VDGPRSHDAGGIAEPVATAPILRRVTEEASLTGSVRRAVAHRAGKANRRIRWSARRVTAAARLRPNYLVLGAQKAGTTSLHNYLAEHPAVLTASVKEVRYFNRFYAKGDAWYVAHFPLAFRGRVAGRRLENPPAVGEASAVYLFDPRVPERVHAFDPGMRLIALLRDPVERAYSHYQMEVRWGREPLALEDAIEREQAELPQLLEHALQHPLDTSDGGFPRSYIARGRYTEQLERWLRFFPREQLLVLTSDDLRARPAQVMSDVARFLAIPEYRAGDYPLAGVRDYPEMPAAIRERLEAIFEPEDERLRQLLGRELPWASATTPTAGGA
jgi:Sulfotransferase domain